MKIPNWSRLMLLAWAQRVMFSRVPDQVIHTKDGMPYLYRWWITPRRKWLPKVYLHKIVASDDDRALHDHPWANCSILLRGIYYEVVDAKDMLGHKPTKDLLRRDEGQVIFRAATARHRLCIVHGDRPISLFITGPNTRRWGFWCPQGWVHWKVFTERLADGKTRGCG